MKRLTLLFGALLAAALCTLPTADAAAQPKPTKYNLCRKHPADGPYIVYDAEKDASVSYTHLTLPTNSRV